ncbi:MAG: hypothetical protein KatS3mg076_2339 [Candidatus Binatia bacterium]|nr:MAG: hypothetical protein KatS3mg076_2339 [Candidatus Binatia bacterium]
MSEWGPRVVLAAVGAAVLLSVLVFLRGRERESEVPPPGSVRPKQEARAGRGFGSGRARGFDFGSEGRERSGFGRPLSRPEKSRTVSPAGAAKPESEREGTRLAVQPLPEDVARAYSRGGSPLLQGPPPAAGSELPEGTKLAVSFAGSGESSDTGVVPIIEENVVYGVDGGAFFPLDARLAYPDRGGVQDESGTIAFWIKPSWNGGDPTDNSFIQLRTHAWDNRLHVFKNGVFLRFLVSDDNGIEHNVGASIAGWKADQWHHVAVTWGEPAPEEGVETVTSLYVDGVLVERNPHNGKFRIPEGTPLYVGSDRVGGAPGANAVIANLRVIEFALTPEEIRQLYVETRPAENGTR